jgi:cysteine-rich repeat protein
MSLHNPTIVHIVAILSLCLGLGACAEGNVASQDGEGCGNGILQAGESCDDGNLISGDGCSEICTLESGECGNGILEAGEGCDDGNINFGDGCNDLCVVEAGGCGDGNLNGGEECDDGNTASGDGCSSTCRGECGNGTRDSGEECDDGNSDSGDGCSSDCQLEGSGPFCGNGVRDDGEECDDGNTVSSDGCSATCSLEAGTCGDGTINIGEACDDGNTSPNDGCDAVCQLEGAVCGNGTIEAGEECEDGNALDNDGCSHLCRVERCGDGVLQPGEQCEDGNVTAGDGCNATCQSEQTVACGNGVLEIGEECDDGNTTAGDGCDATCNQEQSGICTADFELFCGSNDSWNTTFSGSTNEINQYSCVSWTESGREYTYSFVAPTSSAVRLTLSGLTSDLDLFVIGGGACVDDNCTAYGDDTLTFNAVAGQTYNIVVDGYLGAEGPYSLSLVCGACGDGTVDAGEECDDGNTTAGDGCSASCVLEGCGNGSVDVGEQCDDGDTNSCDGCSDACMVEECGNGVLDCGETCDDGNTTAGDGCDSVCQVEGEECTAALALECGDTDSWSTTLFGSTDVVDSYSCVSWNESGREYAYSFTAPITGQVSAALSNLDGVDLDVFVIDAEACSSENCTAFGNTSATFSAVAGETYYVVVDGFDGAEGDYTLDLSCGGGFCGDGIENAGEECDDGGNANNDGCSSTCVIEGCGDGVIQSGEECDDGNTNNDDGCDFSCQIEAGVCLPVLEAVCNSSDSWSTTLAGSTDNVDGYSCNDWDESGREYAYAFAPATTTTMTINLTPETGVDLDLFVLTDDGNGFCQSGECTLVGDNSVSATFTGGEVYWIVVDGFAGAEGDYEIDFVCP